MHGSRLRRSVVLLTVLLAVLGAGVLALMLRGDDTATSAASWQLLGVSADGRTLTIREPQRGACDTVRSRVTADDDRITIAVSLSQPREGDCVAMLFGGRKVRLRLDRPVAGRAVTGEKRKLAPPYRVDQNGRSDRDLRTAEPRSVPNEPAPNVVGLRYQDARHALCNAGLQARPKTPGGDRGEVVAQAPPARQRRSGPPRPLTCSNGLLPAVTLRTAR
jgi:hypothetical protein